MELPHVEMMSKTDSPKCSMILDKLFKSQIYLPSLQKHLITNTVNFPIQRSLSPPVFIDDFGDPTTIITIDDSFFNNFEGLFVDGQNQIHSSVMGDETYNVWKNIQEQFRRPIIVINGNDFPFKNVELNQDQLKILYFYLINTMDSYVNKPYSILYIDDSDDLLLDILKMLYAYFPQKYHNNLDKMFLLLNPTVKLQFTSTHFKDLIENKVICVKELFDLYKEIPAGIIPLPNWVIDGYTTQAHPIFGLSVSDVSKHPYQGTSQLPFVVEATIQYFSASPNALSTEGIFRLSGNKDIAEKYIKQLNYCKLTSFPLNESPHVVCSVFKTYLQSLPDPLLTSDIGEKAVKIFSSGESEDVVINELRNLLKVVPAANRRLVLSLVNLAQLISQQEALNKMNSVNMGTIFGPYIYWKEYSVKAMAEVKCVNALFTYLTKNIHSFIDIMFE
ncbi:Rho-GAP domain-containing protein [Entamoeba marina]